jgi:hypothetical protein
MKNCCMSDYSSCLECAVDGYLLPLWLVASDECKSCCVSAGLAI